MNKRGAADQPRPHVLEAQAALDVLLSHFLGEQREIIAARVRAKAHTHKRETDETGRDEDKVYDIDWTKLFQPVRDILEPLAEQVGSDALLDVGITDTGITAQVNADAVEAAANRAAEMVGKKLVGGELVDNPDAQWAISQTTRDGLKQLVETAEQEGQSVDQLADAIRTSALFSKSRAEMIALTETSRADNQGNLNAWAKSGVVQKKRWILGTTHLEPDECNLNVLAGDIDLHGLFPTGDYAPPQHPRCRCALRPVVTFKEPKSMKLYAEITKFDEDQRMVFGYASTEAMDSQKEIVHRDAIKAALPSYLKFGNIREMHQSSAVGVTKGAEMDDKGLLIEAHIVDDTAWKKVKAGVYKGFSIGGKVTSRDAANKAIITGLDLSEISLVDRPANPEAMIELFKAHDGDTTDIVPLEEIAKTFTAEDLEKAGRRNSAADQDKLQAIHDHSCAMGANCDANKADITGSLSKAHGDLESLRKAHTELAIERDNLTKAVGDLTGERDTLRTELDTLKAQPAPDKAVLKTVGKAEDVGGVAKADVAKAAEPERETWFKA